MNTPAQVEKGRFASRSWLVQNLGAPWLRVVDVRRKGRDGGSGTRLRAGGEEEERGFLELGPRAGWMRLGPRPRVGRVPEAFRRGHLPGAVHLDVRARLFNEAGTIVSAPEFAIVMSEHGIGDEHVVVLVDESGFAGTALVAAWALEKYGHAEARVLAGGYTRWVSESGPISREDVRPSFASFTARSSA